MSEKILIYDFGSQYTQLIARRLRELNVYCEIHPYNSSVAVDSNTKGVILSGSPCSVNDINSPDIDFLEISATVPLLGICYGAQLMAKKLGGTVGKSEHREYGRANMIQTGENNALLDGLSFESQVWMSHGDTITQLPDNTKIIAKTDSIPVAAFEVINQKNKVYGIQFHPEVYHSTEGLELLRNFAYNICSCIGDWTPGHFIDESVANLQTVIGISDKVILGLWS
jgi:GMP synthase (glutamine-hydrolysing)